MAVRTAFWWRPTNHIARVLIGLLAVEASVTLAVATFDRGRWLEYFDRWMQATLDGHQAAADRWLQRLSDTGSPLRQLTSLLGLASGILVIVWLWRSMHNMQAAGRRGARLSPGWAIGAWFIPVANLVLPYLMFQDLWRSSDPRAEPGNEWRRLPGSPLVAIAWLLWVAGTLAMVVPLVILASSRSTTAGDVVWLLRVGQFATGAGYALAIPVVRALTDRQQVLASSAPQTSGAADPRFGTPATTGGAGWHPDPHGQHDHRYWDGSAWTEHVADAGVTSTAPVLAPEWHRDPTGRFEWRFWDGYAWTEHVSRDGVLSIDPLEQPER